MKNRLLHTPEGVRDIYNEECAKKIAIQNQLQKTIDSYGYRNIQTPTFEFFDIFGREIGTTPSKELYKFFDRQGNTLVLRPDITPSIARSVAKYFSEEDMPIRLSYMGNTFINNHSYQGRLKETTQLGCELIGDNSVDADAEIIAIVIQSLLSCGLKDFQISIGHANILKGLIAQAELDEELEERICELIANKNFFGVDEELEQVDMDADLKQLFSMLGKIYNDTCDFEEAKKLATKYEKISHAIANLEELDSILEFYGVSKYVSYELGMLTTYSYYTGIIFAGYTFGSGEPIVKGGRYDKLLSYFGKDAASIGFAFNVDQLIVALTRQKIQIAVENNMQLVVYSEKTRQEAIAIANSARENGERVQLILKQPHQNQAYFEEYQKRNKIASMTLLIEE